MGESVKVYGSGFSPYSARVEISLKMKGVEYEFVGEDLRHKSEDLLKYNPIHKKVPVLIHGGKPMAESLVIMEYIDETWKDKVDDLLSSDPYERAYARFWAKFIDDKLLPGVVDALMSRGEAGEMAAKDAQAHEVLKFLENEINGKKFFGGNGIGFLDIACIGVAYWIPVFQEVEDKELLTKDEYPGICTWIDHFMACNVVKESVRSREEMLAFYRERLPAMRAANVRMPR